MRLFLTLVVVIAIGFVGLRMTAGTREAGGGAGLMPSVPAGAPSELQEVLGKFDGVRNGAIPRLPGGLLRRKAAQSEAVADAPPPPFADQGRPGRITRVKRAVRRGLRRSSAQGTRLRVVAWQGVIVVGHRAAVRADVERVVRSPSGPMALPPTRMTLGLLADGGWQIVSSQ